MRTFAADPSAASIEDLVCQCLDRGSEDLRISSCCFGFSLGIVMAMNETVVYQNAPVVLVALEVRHPTADPLTSAESRAIKKHLMDVLPVERAGQQFTMQVIPGASGQMATTETFPRFMNRKMTLAVSIKKEAIVVEASDYPGWIEFRELVERVLEARQEVAPIVGADRIGLRYIDEIRIPGSVEVDWSQWIVPTLLAPKMPEEVELPVSQWQGLTIYGDQPGNMLVFRYGAREGFAVDPSSDLRRVQAADGGSFFLMDIDSFWTPDGPVPEYDRDDLMSTCDVLHHPVRMLFESMITQKLREEVFQRNG